MGGKNPVTVSFIPEVDADLSVPPQPPGSHPYPINQV